MHESSAFLLRRYRFSEASLVVVWFTEKYGKVKTVVRGALKPNSPFAGRLELFSESEISFKVNKKTELHSLQEVTPAVLSNNLTLSYHSLLSASYFAELVDLLTEPMYPLLEVFDLQKRAYSFLRKEEPTVQALYHFEKELAKALGIYDPSVPAGEALSKMLHHLPENRVLLLKQLKN